MIESAWTTFRALQIGLAVLVGAVLRWLVAGLFIVAVLVGVGLVKGVVAAAFELGRLLDALRGAVRTGLAGCRSGLRRLVPRRPGGRETKGQ